MHSKSIFSLSSFAEYLYYQMQWYKINKFRISNLVLTHPTFCLLSANEKSYPPTKEEAVHRLERISPKGKHYHDLADKNITTVKHLMRHYHRDLCGLQKVNIQL